MEDSNIDHVQKEGRPDIDTTNDAMPPLYTATEIADYLHVSRSTVHRLIEDGSLREPASGRRCDSPRTTYASSTRSNQSTGRLTHGCSAGQRSIRPFAAHRPWPHLQIDWFRGQSGGNGARLLRRASLMLTAYAYSPRSNSSGASFDCWFNEYGTFRLLT